MCKKMLLFALLVLYPLPTMAQIAPKPYPILLGENLPDGSRVFTGSSTNKYFLFVMPEGKDWAAVGFLNRVDSGLNILIPEGRIRFRPTKVRNVFRSDVLLNFGPLAGRQQVAFRTADKQGTFFFPGRKGVWADVEEINHIRSDVFDYATIEITVDPQVKVGQPVRVIIKVTNRGVSIWKRQFHPFAVALGKPGSIKSGPPELKILSQEALATSIPDRNRLMLMDEDAIKPGQSKTFHFTLDPPQKPGIYAFEASMVIEGGKATGSLWTDGYFGDREIGFFEAVP